MTVPNQVTQPAPQAAPATKEEAFTGFAKNLLGQMTDGDANNIEQPDEGLGSDDIQEEAKPVEEQPAEEPAEQEAEEAAPAEPEIPMVELELEDGEKVNVPEKLKGYFMRDKDYRQKTMALAEQRKAFESMQQQAQQIAVQAQQMAPYHAQLVAMDNRAQQIEQSLTQDLATTDPIEFNRRQGELAILLRNRDSLASGLHQQMSRLYEQQAELKTKKLEQDAPKLFEEIPELSKAEERNSLGKWVREQGLSDEEFAHMNYSIAATKLAWKARQFDRMVKEQATAKAKLKETVKTVPPVAKSSRAPDPDANTKQQRKDWKKGGGQIRDENFSALLRSRLGLK